MSQASAVSPAPTSGVRSIGFAAPLGWLARGWKDLWRQPAASLFYGVAIAVAGAVILGVTAQPALSVRRRHHRVPAGGADAGGRAVRTLAPLSRRRAGDAGRFHVAWRRNPSALVGFALLSILAGTAWQVASVVIVALFYKGPALAPMAMMIEVLVNPQHYLLFFVYMCAGGLLAALVFAVSVVSMPMLVDRRCDLLTALVHQRQCRGRESAAAGAVGAILMLLTGLGFATPAGHDRDPALARPRQLPRLQRPGRIAVVADEGT
jgi:uncharacterized membrane protein